MRCRSLVVLLATLVGLVGCPGEPTAPLAFSPEPLTAPDARPFFTSSATGSLINNSGQTYQVSGITVSAQDAGQANAFAVTLSEAAPIILEPGESVGIDIVFSPTLLGDYAATVTAVTRLISYDIGGGGCSSGCGGDAPSDSELLVQTTVQATADANANFEDCDDGEDNDGDGLVDCDDPDCADDPNCQGDDEDCNDGVDNDGDGLVDCDDPDCEDDPNCGEIIGCEPGGEIECGGVVTGSTVNSDDNWQNYCGSGANNWFGGEDIWVFVPEGDGTVEIAAQSFGWNLDLTVLEAEVEDGEISCDPDRCAANSWQFGGPGEFLDFFADSELVYFIVIDGRGPNPVGDYTLQVQCAVGGTEDICDDGLDNDGDGLVDCADPDCAGDPSCGEDCEPSQTLQCPATIVTGNTGGGDATNAVLDWCDEGFDGWTGPEVAYLFSPNTTGEVQVNAGGWQGNGDLDLSVILVPPPGPNGEIECEPDFCVETSWNPGGQPEQLTFDAFAGTSYIIALDGWDGAVSEYQLVLDCGGAGGEICDDGIDNDNDGDIDCDDFDCFGDPNCQGGNEICDDGIDNDGDGQADCDDILDCQAFPGCDYGGCDCCEDNGTAGCENDLGEDCVCAADPFCCEVTWDAICADVFQNTCGGACDSDPEADCSNGVDDDGDGLVDCDDADCFNDPVCLAPQFETDCANNIDDDGDGAVDCDDSDCILDPNCIAPGSEICNDGIDNDADGDIDCDDSDCVLDAACDAGDGECCAPGNPSPGCDDEVGEDCVCAADPFCCNVEWDGICADAYENQCGGTCAGTEDCANGVDDDGDGAVDCDDVDCINDPNCIAPPVELQCNDGIDNDGDGLTDCADADCAADPNCQNPTEELDCANGIDDDADGDIDCEDSDCTFDAACDAGDGDCCVANGTPGCVDEPGEDCVCALDPFCCNNQWDGLCATQYQNQCGGSCTGTEVCDNLLDDDGDGDVDCDDSDCIGDPNCFVPSNETDCANNIDDDQDGAIDCDDSDCVLDPNCNIPPVETSCVDGIDNDQDGATDCADSDCATHPSCVNPPEANCANGIDDDADGLTDCNDSDCQFDPNCANGELDCADGIDNDGDGLVDCNDGDCSADINCVATGACNPIGNLSCGDVISGSNSMAGSTNIQDEYCGFNPAGWSGPEVSWLFTPPADGFVDVTLTGLTADLDIQALVQDGNSCDPNDCEANGWNPPPQPEQMDWFAFAGTPYYILIDGWQGAVSNFTMTITCTPLNEIDCSDGIDDDQDGLADCDDIDCLGDAACPETNCTDGVDNDADGFIDCNDTDCFGTVTCIPEFLCTNGLDDDSDGDTDCDDSDCANDPACFVPSTETDCANGIDDDQDGFTDCADADCAADPNCVVTPEVCDNGVDDDGDGFTDCADADCLNDPNCVQIEVCNDGFDNDGDGDEDCFDTDCAGFPGCATETDCSNGFDDDADGLADCNDTDCFGQPGCPVVLFSSVDDDPTDFVHVPLGQNSSSVVWELGVPNTAPQSGNGPTSAFGGTEAWCTGCSVSVEDSGRFQAYMVANPTVFDLSTFSGGQLILSFEHWQVSPGVPWVDTARVDVSPDGGTNIITEWGPNVSSTGTWDRVEVDLSAYLGGDLTFGFRYDTLFGFGQGQDDDGWYIDDVELIWFP